MTAAWSPELRAGRGRKRTEAEIIRPADESEAACREDDAAGARAARVPKAFGKRFGDAKRLAIRDVARVHVDGDEFAPGRRPAWQMPIRVAKAAKAGERSFVDVA